MADSPISSHHQSSDYHAYASNGLQVLQAATNAHQAIFQEGQDHSVDEHHDLQQAAQQASQHHLHQPQDSDLKHEQQPHHESEGTPMPQTPGHHHLTLPPGLSGSPARIIADPAALAAVAAAAGAQDTLTQD